MIVSKVENGAATVVLSQNEARVLNDALTIAVLQVGPELLVGSNGRNRSLLVEHLRRVLADIS